MTERYIRIKGEVLVGVPADLRGITSWVLLEQEDWFEKELAFVRRWLRPGMRVVDIGANIGVYALTMAKLVAPTGKVWAFEPTSSSAAILGRSIAQNRLDNLQLVPKALSDHEGEAVLHCHWLSELNSLVRQHGEGQIAGRETVAISTLDREQALHDWGAIDFVKIDAEGMGLAILKGGEKFLADQSPLIMFEADDSQAGNDPTALPAAFRRLGFDIYRLVGPDLFLAPVERDEIRGGFDLNLFACKADRAARLAEMGLLVAAVPSLTSDALGDGCALFARQAYAPALPATQAPSAAYRQALDAYAGWRETAAPLPRRYAALSRAFAAARKAVEEKPSIARLATAARIAFELDEHQAAVDLVVRAVPLLQSKQPLDEPLFPPLPRFDAMAPLGMADRWLFAATLEAYEVLRAFSAYFRDIDPSDLARLDWLQASPFASAPMERRRQMLRVRARLQGELQASPLLTRAAPDHLNPEFWRGKDLLFPGLG